MSPGIRKEIRSIISALPEGSTVYLFGSAARGKRYNDVDLLILYDPALCPPSLAHKAHRAFVDGVAELLDAPVHLSLLTYAEERGAAFIARVRAVPLKDAPTPPAG